MTTDDNSIAGRQSESQIPRRGNGWCAGMILEGWWIWWDKTYIQPYSHIYTCLYGVITIYIYIICIDMLYYNISDNIYFYICIYIYMYMYMFFFPCGPLLLHAAALLCPWIHHLPPSSCEISTHVATDCIGSLSARHRAKSFGMGPQWSSHQIRLIWCGKQSLVLRT